MSYHGYRADINKDGTQQLRAWNSSAAEWVDMEDMADVPESVQHKLAILQLAAVGATHDKIRLVRVDNVGTYYLSHKGIALWVDSSKLDTTQ